MVFWPKRKISLTCEAFGHCSESSCKKPRVYLLERHLEDALLHWSWSLDLKCIVFFIYILSLYCNLYQSSSSTFLADDTNDWSTFELCQRWEQQEKTFLEIAWADSAYNFYRTTHKRKAVFKTGFKREIQVSPLTQRMILKSSRSISSYALRESFH